MIERTRTWMRRHLAASSFRRSVLTLLSGSSVAMGLSYLARPLLTRLYPPDAFGLLSFYMAVVTVLATAASARYEDAIILPERDEDAASLLALSMGIMLGLTVLSGSVALWRTEIAALFGEARAAPYLLLVSPGLLVVSLMRLGVVWETRLERFRTVSLSRVAASGAKLPVQIAAGLSAASAAGLIGGTLAGWSAAVLLLAGLVPRRDMRAVLAARWHTMRRLARRYRDFPRFALPSTLLNKLSSQLPIFGLLFFFMPSIAGYYALSYSALAVPMGMISSSVGQVYYVRAAEAHRTDALRPLTRNVVRRLIMLGLFPLLAVIVAGPDLFAFVFGETWRTAGSFAQFLAPWTFFVFVTSPLTRLFDVLERQRAELLLNVLLLILRGSALLIGGLLDSPTIAVALFGIASALAWCAVAGGLLRWSGVALQSALGVLGRYAGWSAGPLLLLVLIEQRAAEPGWVVLSAAATFLLYGLLLFWEGDFTGSPASSQENE